MSHFPERDARALVVVDAQRDVMAETWQRDRVVATIATLVARARATSTPVVWVQRRSETMPHGGEGWQIVDELTLAPGEPLVDAAYPDAFADTHLVDVLGTLDVGEVILVGARSGSEIRATATGAAYRGYDVTLVQDAHTTRGTEADGVVLDAEQLVAVVNTFVWREDLPGVDCQVVSSDELVLDSPPDDAEVLTESELDDETDEELTLPAPDQPAAG